MKAYEFIEASLQNGIALIELNRPAQYNALNRTMVQEIIEVVEAFDKNEEVLVIVLTGRGHAFSAGADIDEMAADDPGPAGAVKSVCAMGPSVTY